MSLWRDAVNRERAEWTRPVTVKWWRLLLALNLAGWGGVWLEYFVPVAVALLVIACVVAGMFSRGAHQEGL